MQTIHFALMGGCDAFVGGGAVRLLGQEAAKAFTGRKAALITDSGVPAEHIALCEAELKKAGKEPVRLVLPAGEPNKTLAAAESICSFLYENGFTRSDGAVCAGGGVPLDIAGFAAAIYMRGIAFVSVPTTLIAQTDSAYGGKTGVDFREGKNLIGCFSQPKAVVCDTDFLRTLPERELACGMGEVIKYGAAAEPEILSRVSRAIPDDDTVAECVRIKRRFAEEDFYDTGVRRVLNFGHTFGHAFEAASGYSLSHGQAVAYGMLAAIRLGQKLGATRPGVYEAVLSAIKSAGLGADYGELWEGAKALIRRDKKSDGSGIAFVLLEDLGRPVISRLSADRILNSMK